MLGTQFLAPPAAEDALRQAARLYVRALELEPLRADGVPSASRLDVLSNGGHAWVALADLVDELGARDADGMAAQAVAAAVTPPSAASLPALLYMVAAQWFERTSDGQRAVLQAAMPSSAPARHDAPAPPDTDGGDALVFTTSLVAPSSLLESYVDQLGCCHALLPHAPDDVALRSVGDTSSAVLQRAQTYVDALAPGAGDAQSPRGEWAAQLAALEAARVSLTVAHAQRAGELGAPLPAADVLALEDAIDSAAAAALAAPPPAQSLSCVRLDDADGSRTRQLEAQVTQLCDLADHAHLLARLRVLQLDRGDTDAAARAWSLAGRAAKLLLAAVAPFEAPASTSAALGLDASAPAWVAPDAPRPPQSNTSTTVSRARAGMYAELAAVSLTRAHDALARAYAPAADARAKLYDHARIYGRKALADAGLGWVHAVAPPPPSPPEAAALEAAPVYVYSRALAHARPPGGWESVVKDVEWMLGCVRAIWLRGTHHVAHREQAQHEVSAIAAAARSLCMVEPTYALALTGPAAMARAVDDVLPPAPAEEAFWHEQWAAAALPSSALSAAV